MTDEFSPCMFHDHKDGKFSITFSEFDDFIEFIEERGGQGGGYSWESMVKAVLMLRQIDLPEVDFDPEGDMFCAISSDRHSLTKIAAIIKELSADRLLMESAIKHATENEYFE